MRKFLIALSSAILIALSFVALSAPAHADGENDFISWVVGCETVTFTNNSDETVYIDYGSLLEDDPDGSVELPAGESHTVTTDREWLDFMTFADSSDGSLADGDEVPQNCDDSAPSATKKPKAAPAAGI